MWRFSSVVMAGWIGTQMILSDSFWEYGVFVPACVLGFVAFAVLAAEMFIDVSAFRPEAVLAAGAFLALSTGSLPAVKRSGQDKAD